MRRRMQAKCPKLPPDWSAPLDRTGLGGSFDRLRGVVVLELGRAEKGLAHNDFSLGWMRDNPDPGKNVLPYG